jgi:hypothetical protein
MGDGKSRGLRVSFMLPHRLPLQTVGYNKWVNLLKQVEITYFNGFMGFFV